MKGSKLTSFLVIVLILAVLVENTIAQNMNSVQKDEASQGPSQGPIADDEQDDAFQGPSQGPIAGDEEDEASQGPSQGPTAGDEEDEASQGPVAGPTAGDDKEREAEVIENINICLERCQPQDPKAEVCPIQCVISEIASHRDLLERLIKEDRKIAQGIFCMVGCEGSQLCHDVNTLGKFL